MATRYLFYSHDGYGLGHVRRNSRIARAILREDADAVVSLVTGLSVDTRWLRESSRVRIHRVPPLLKSGDGSYRSDTLSFEAAVRERERRFSTLVADERPDVVVVDRHPYGTAGELRVGLGVARRNGAAVVLGLRDVLDEPEVVREEMTGRGWQGVDDVFDEVLVYGQGHFLDHESEYGLSRTPTYCGWVVDPVSPTHADPNLLVVSAGGGGDGAAVFELGAELLADQTQLHGLFAPGPFADLDAVRRAGMRVQGRAMIADEYAASARWFARAGAILCMAGYNSTLEALASGMRPILMPRRSPRREQEIRAVRLASLGLADVVDEGADVADVAELLRRPRMLRPGALDAAGIDLDGARTAAACLHRLAGVGSRR